MVFGLLCCEILTTDLESDLTLKFATAQSLAPDIDILVAAKRCQVSSSRSAMNK